MLGHQQDRHGAAGPQILPAIEQYRQFLDFVEIVPVSALKGENVELLAQRLLANLPAGERLYPEDFLTDQPERFFVAEMIREQILRQTREEVPYAHRRGHRLVQGGRGPRADRGFDPRGARHPEGHPHRRAGPC